PGPSQEAPRPAAAVAGGASGVPAVAIGTGQARLRAWSRFEGGIVADALVKLAADGVQADVDGQRLPLRALSAEARADRQPDGSTMIVFRKLHLDDDRGFPLSAIDGESKLVLASDARPLAARLSLGRFDTASLAELAARLPVPEDLRSRFAPLRIAGVVNRLAFDSVAGRVAGDASAG